MLFTIASHLPLDFWNFVNRLGEAQLLLPTALALAGWLALTGERRAAAVWLTLFGLAFGLTMASKIAFIGWGVGSAWLNFTGVSGHAMHSAAVLPLLLRCAAGARPPGVRVLALALGLALAALIAVSRVVIGAHSMSESVAGFALGSAASMLTVALHAVPARPLPHWLLAVLLAAQLLNPFAAPILPTHGMVTQLALAVSGHDRPYTRAMLHQRGDCWVPDWTTARGRSCP
jgi:membrane-associated phospholipid phosphatase